MLWLAALVVNLVASAAIVLAFNYLWGSLAFWAPRGAEEINSSSTHLLDGLKPFPLDGLGSAPLVGLLTVVPSGFVGWYRSPGAPRHRPIELRIGAHPAGGGRLPGYCRLGILQRTEALWPAPDRSATSPSGTAAG